MYLFSNFVLVSYVQQSDCCVCVCVCVCITEYTCIYLSFLDFFPLKVITRY